jgi:hypothetical protein
MYTEDERTELFDAICESIIIGKSLRKALNEVDLPAKTFFIWLREDETKSKQYAQAATERAELMFEDMLDIADDGRNDFIESEDGTRLNSENIQRSRLRVDTRKWALSKMMPKKYGDKLDLTTGGEKIQPQQTQLTPEQIDKAIENL